jgi:iron(III) transport system ATP-binding protein
MTTVRLSGVSKAYAAHAPALVETDITIASGEFFTLLGPSGCGKTTTLRLIAGFESPTTGSVLFDDRDVTSLPPQRRSLGMVFQNYALFPHLDVAENVAYGLRAQRVAPAECEQRVHDALATVGLGAFADRAVSDLSGGQQQRVALARALVVAPAVLLLDEPLSNLDALLRESTRTQVRSLQHSAGITTVYVTHDQAEALAVSDRIAVLQAGTVHQIGTPWEIYHRPATRFVAEFIGRANLLDVTAIRVEHRDLDTLVQVELPGGTVASAVTTASPVAGDPLSLVVRPERLRLVAPGHGQIDGTVTMAEFLGSTSLVHVSADGLTSPIRVSVPEDGAGRVALGEGTRVGIDLSRAESWAVAS